MKKYEPRLGPKFDKGDTLALEAMNQELQGLQREQERTRIQGLIKGANDEQLSQFSQALSQQGVDQPGIPQGGPSGLAGGQAPQATGQPQFRGGGQLPQWLYEARGNQFAGGGNLPRYQGLGEEDNFLPVNQPLFRQGQYGQGFTPSYAQDVGPLTAPTGPTGFAGQGINLGTDLSSPEALEQLAPSGLNQANLRFIPQDLSAPGGDNQDNDGITPFKSRVPYLGAVSQGLGSILANRNIDFGDDKFTPQQVVPQTISLGREREQLQRDRDIANATIRGGQGTGGSRAKLNERLLAGATGTQRNLGRGLSRSFQTEAVTNAQIRNQAGQFNAQQRSIAGRLNQQQTRENLLINEQRRSGRIGGAFGAATQYGKDLMSADQYDQMLKIMAPQNFEIGQGEDSRLRRLLQVSPTAQRFFQDRGQRTASS
jgi:hypothetical protein